ncbi:Aminomethyltransferase [Maioricimonas rarisocia]|uniref:Aminomethyltransferase n=1 Tax=Maioricimonas rarisocia TaxID=2528026 RepID=A0A517ZAL6_9PLAN|nr:glycine cleavage T C-terminal barrel domain-containing protein [Maioricimonas rarisocia]QDU39471.1 Aminomethyltransferase [Maioricimonas rarisocia]
MSIEDLRKRQQEQSARWESDRSVAPADFGAPAEEYRAATTAAALFDLTVRSHIELTGADRATFLHNFCTNDIKRLAPGQGCEAFITSIKGRILGHVLVFATDTSLWLESDAGTEGELVAHLDKYLIVEDVEIHRRSSEEAELLCVGPEAAGRLNDVLGIDTAAIPADGVTPSEFEEQPVQVRRTSFTGYPEWAVVAPVAILPVLWSRLTEAGLRSAGALAFEALRIQAGMPRVGVDISEENIAQEANRTEEAISFTKGCYLGQEPIARLDALGHVNKLLCVLRIESDQVPAAGATVVDDGGKDLGRITSATVSPESGQVVALGILKASHAKPETAVAVRGEGDAALVARVASTQPS